MHQFRRVGAALGASWLGVSWLGASLAIAAGSWTIATKQAGAIQLADGTVYFAEAPRLLSVSSTQKVTQAWGSTYYFTFTVPENAGEPLQRLAITQHEGAETLEYDLEETRSFQGTQFAKGANISLGRVTADENKRTVSILFDPPVPPGKTVTVGLRPYQNPQYTGIYLFGVTAYPPGEKAHGQFLGYGRLHFYNSGDSGR